MVLSGSHFGFGGLNRLSDFVNFDRRARLDDFGIEIVDVRADGLGCEMRCADSVSVDNFSVVD